MAKTPAELATIGVIAEPTNLVPVTTDVVITDPAPPDAPIPVDVPSAPPVGIETSPAPLDEHAGQGGSYRIDPETRQRVLISRTLGTH